MADIDRFLTPISETAPCGEDIANAADSLFADLKAAAKCLVKNRIVPDDSGVMRTQRTVEEPDWSKVRELCEQALERSRDLRVCIPYAVALAEMEGLDGVANGLELMRGMIVGFWEPLYPTLDPDDVNDPSQRFGIIGNLSLGPMPAGEDSYRFVDRVRRAPLFKTPKLGPVRLTDSDAADRARAAFAELRASGQTAALHAGKGAVDRSLAALSEIEEFLEQATGGQFSSSILERLMKTLTSQKLLFDSFDSQAERESPAATVPEAVTSVSHREIRIAGSPATFDGAVNGPKDVVYLLEKICAYYAVAEPSSPVPLLLRRATRLVGKSFVEVVQDLLETSDDQMKRITGEPEQKP